MKLVILIFFNFALFLTTRGSENVDNGIYGEPEIQCGSDAVTISLNTHNIFEGHLYVKGHYDEVGCRTDATNDRTASIKIPFIACGVRRERSVNPLGLLITATVIVTFHPMFVTRVDKAYNVKCFYMSADKPVTANIEVSMFTTQLLTQNLPMPVCRYEVLEKSSTGLPLKFAMVGQEVYHKWTCDSEAKNIYCMTVHSCFVDDGKDKKVQLLDENGCAQDKYLMGNLYYDNDLEGGVNTLVFKYADKPTLYFQCQIRLHYKEDSYKCQRTSDVCPWPTRGKRQVPTVNSSAMAESEMKRLEQLNFQKLASDSFDVYTEPLTILDIDDNSFISENDLRHVQEELTMGQEGSSKSRSQQYYRRLRNNKDSLCFSPLSFGIVSAALALVLLTSLIATLLLCIRKTSKKGQF